MRIFEKLVKNIQREKEIRGAKKLISNYYLSITDYDISTAEYLVKNMINMDHAIKRCDVAISMGRDAQKEVLAKYDIQGLGIEKNFGSLERIIRYIEYRKSNFPQVYAQYLEEQKVM